MKKLAIFLLVLLLALLAWRGYEYNDMRHHLRKLHDGMTYAEVLALQKRQAEAIRQELTETGYLRPRKKSGFKEKKSRPQPMKYRLSGGMTCLVGRNNKEND